MIDSSSRNPLRRIQPTDNITLSLKIKTCITDNDTGFFTITEHQPNGSVIEIQIIKVFLPPQALLHNRVRVLLQAHIPRILPHPFCQ